MLNDLKIKHNKIFLVIRFINAVAMRYIVSSICVAVALMAYFLIIGKNLNFMPKTYNPYFALSALIVSMVWSALFVYTKPSIFKRHIYPFQNGKIIFGRIVILLLCLPILTQIFKENSNLANKLSYSNEMLNSLFVFTFSQFLIATIILLFKKSIKPSKVNTKNYEEPAQDTSEAEVDYALKWLSPKGYKQIKKILNVKNNKEEIRLRCNSVMQESQEFDHIVVGKNGVFNIETKNYSGTIKIDSNGNWVRIKKNGETVGEKSPIAQVDRHHLVLEGILKSNYEIVDIICMAHPEAIIEGAENSPVPVVKADMIARYILSHQTDKTLSEDEITRALDLIEKHRVLSKQEAAI